MKKIIIVNNNLEIGGVQTSLVNLLNEIHDKYEITLLLFRNKEEYKALIPDDVKVISIKSPFKYFGVSQRDLKDRPFMFSARAFWYCVAKLFGRAMTIKLMLLFQKTLLDYDCAISYLHESNHKLLYGGCNEFVIKKVHAKEKIAWIHCDFKNNGADINYSRAIYKRFDKIIACSDGAMKAFISCFPEFEQKIFSVRNCNDYAKIKTYAENAFEYDKSFFNIVTVARLSPEKGIDRALVAIKNCINHGYSVMYHVVGDGIEKIKLQKLASELGIKDNVVFYGNQSNPYTYMKNANLFLLTSYHEAAPMVFDEVASLGVPVLATKTTSTDEMILKSGSGFVCENHQIDINNSLLNILQNPDTLVSIQNNLKSRIFDNTVIITQLQQIIK